VVIAQLQALRAVWFIRKCQFELDIDGQPYCFRASEIVVANGAIVGLPSLRIAPDVCFDDGRFNVCIVRARTLWDYLGIGRDMLPDHGPA